MTEYAGWVHYDGNVSCPRCNKHIPCDDEVPSILAAIPGHDCYTDPGMGHYLHPPEVPENGWYWAEADGTKRRISGQGGLPLATQEV
jgi:hypothetical protein